MLDGVVNYSRGGENKFYRSIDAREKTFLKVGVEYTI